MHKPESVLENEMHKILWDFETQTDHLIPIPDFVIINNKKENLPNSWFYRPGGQQNENQRKHKER